MVVKGGDLMLFLNKEAAGSTKENPKYEKVSIGYATSHSLSISADTKETSTKDSGGKWQTSEVGIISWTASSENLYANDAQGFGYSDLFDIMVSRTPIDAVFGVEGNSKNLEADKKIMFLLVVGLLILELLIQMVLSVSLDMRVR